MIWKCKKCGNILSAPIAPLYCPISCCEMTNSYEEDQTIILGASKWKCTNCGNRTSENNKPKVCKASCCKATNSYVPID